MAHYRKKPVVIEAFQFNYSPGYDKPQGVRDTVPDAPDWFMDALIKPDGTPGKVYLHLNGLWVIWTLEGVMEINPGDYVIKGVQGELYPCKPSIFAATYEHVASGNGRTNTEASGSSA